MSLPDIDTLIFFFINRDIQNSFFDLLMPFITDRSYAFYLPFFLYLLLKNKKDAITALILAFGALMLADWFSYELKNVFERVRPCHVLDQVRLLKGCSQSFSMPSNHSVNAFAFATPFVILYRNPIRYAFFIISGFVAISRVYVGVHYPSDVVIGSLLGSGTALMIVMIYKRASLRFRNKPSTTILYLFLIVISLFRIYYIFHGPLDLSPDEAHYWEWSRRLDISYYSKGPMIAYLIFIGTQIFGDQVIGIRIMAVIFSALSSIFLYLFGTKVYDERVGVMSAVVFQITPLFSTFGVIFTIDSPFIFFWILSLYLFWRALIGYTSLGSNERSFPTSLPHVNEKKEYTGSRSPFIWWGLLGLSIGFGLLTKYTMAFFYICAFLFLLFSKENRRLLLSGGPYSAFIISLLVFSPVLIWNMNHDWVTFRHTAGQAHVSEGIQISAESFIEFLGSQFGVLTPLLLGFMAIAVWKFKKTIAGSYLFWFSVPVIGFFLLKSIQAKVQANWALPGYLTGVVAFSAYSMQMAHIWGTAKRVLLYISILLALAVTAVAHYPSVLGLPVKLDPTVRLTGWKELGTEVTGIYQQMSLTHPAFIFSDKYQIASELAFYVQGHPITYCVNFNRRMNQYDLWPGFNNLSGYHAIFVREDDTQLPEKIASVFGRVEKKVFTAYTKQHVKIRDYSLFLCYDFKGLQEDKPERF